MVRQDPFTLMDVKFIKKKKILHVQVAKIGSSNIHIKLCVIAGNHHPYHTVPGNGNIVVELIIQPNFINRYSSSSRKIFSATIPCEHMICHTISVHRDTHITARCYHCFQP